MILVDTSIWIDHLGRGNVSQLADLLERELVVMHRYVIGEIALGSLRDRRERLAYLRNLHPVPVATDAEVTALIEWGQLHNTGIGYVDAHLLTAARAAGPGVMTIWTRDKRLHAQAERLGVAAPF
jgi:predicted nucleic acid-binding protein